jgi:hypothetical protein
MNLQTAIIIGFVLLYPYRWVYLVAVLLLLSAAYVVFMWKNFHLHQSKERSAESIAQRA